MTLAALTFVLTLSIVLGAYWTLVARPEAQVAGRLRKRLEVKSDRPVGSASVVKAAPRHGGRGGGIGRSSAWSERHTPGMTRRAIQSPGKPVDAEWVVRGAA